MKCRKGNLVTFVVVSTLVGLFTWWWVSRRLEGARRATSGMMGAAPPPPKTTHRLVLSPGPDLETKPAVAPPFPRPAPKKARPVIADDLKRIEGIGPKISGVLQAVGIQTYTQLAEIDADTLSRILREAGLRLAFPATWPEQAALAAAGDWEGLKSLQGELKGGRRA